MLTPDAALMSVTRLAIYKYDKNSRKNSRLGIGTGFFYRSGNNKIFLITNKHVVYDRDKHHSPDKLRLYLHRETKHFSNITEIDVKLWDRNGKKLWKYSHSYPRADVIAIELSPTTQTDCFFCIFFKG